MPGLQARKVFRMQFQFLNGAIKIEQKKIKGQEEISGISLALQSQFADAEVKINDLKNKKILEQEQELANKKRELINTLADFIKTGLEAEFDNQAQKLDNESQAIDDKSQKEIDAINASTLAQEEKTKRITAIEKQAAFQHEQIEKKKQQQDIARAKFEKAASVISISITTAEAVAKITAAAAVARATYAAIPVVGLAAGAAVSASLLAQIPFVIGTGILQIAAVLARPIPHFKEGTKNAPKGLALVSEEGSELMMNKQGKAFLTPSKPSLIDLAGGEQIFKHDVTKDMLSHHNLLSILTKAQRSKQPVPIDNGYNEKIYRELKSLNGKPPFVINVENGMETSDYYIRNIKT